MDNLVSVTTVLKPFSDYSAVPADVLAAAAARGSEVHRLCALYAKNLWVNEIPEAAAGYFTSFQRWLDQHVVAVHLVEERLTDEVLGFTGEPDLIVTMKGEKAKALIDLKTPQVGNRSWRVQLSAYRHLSEKCGHDIHRVFALRPRPDGKMPAVPPDYEYTGTVHRDFQIFLSALNCWRYFHS